MDTLDGAAAGILRGMSGGETENAARRPAAPGVYYGETCVPSVMPEPPANAGPPQPPGPSQGRRIAR